MSLNKALGTYFSLSKKQRKLLQGKHYTDTLRCSQWLRLITQLITFDQHANQARKQVLTIGLLSLLLSSAITILFATHETIVTLLLFWFIWLFTMTAWYFYFSLLQKGLAAHVEQFILPMLQILQQDMHKNDKLDMTLQCDDVLQSHPMASQSQSTTNCHSPWFSIAAHLQDGSHLQWHINHTINHLMPANNERHCTMTFQIDFPTTIYKARTHTFSKQPSPLVISEQWLTIRDTQKLTCQTQEKAMSLFDFLDRIGQAYSEISINMDHIQHEKVCR